MKSAVVHGRTVRFGRLAPRPGRKLLKLDHYLRGALPAPLPCNWSQKVATWPMMGNDELGDCVEAMKGHAVEVVTTYGRGKTVIVSDAEIKKTYFIETGGPDTGLNIADSLDYWVKHPLGGVSIAAHAAINHRDMNAVLIAAQLFGGLHIGVNLPFDAIPAVNARKDWTSTRYAPDPAAGHAILLVSTEKDWVTFVTWGQLQRASRAWFDKYVEEGHVALAPDWFAGQSLDPAGVDDASLIADFQALTGQKPPVVVDPPPPGPPVPPAPTGGLGAIITLPDGKKWKATGWAAA